MQEDICNHSIATIERVTHCPGNATAIKDRSEKKRCDVYQHCQGKQLVYHCTRYDDGLAEVCAPKMEITGKCLTITWILKDVDWLLQNDWPHVLNILQFQLIVLLAILSVYVCVCVCAFVYSFWYFVWKICKKCKVRIYPPWYNFTAKFVVLFLKYKTEVTSWAIFRISGVYFDNYLYVYVFCSSHIHLFNEVIFFNFRKMLHLFWKRTRKSDRRLHQKLLWVSL